MNKDQVIKVGIVEDLKLFRDGIKLILSGYKDISLMLECPNGYSVIDRLNELTIVPDVMLIDLSLPRHEDVDFNGDKVLKKIKYYYPEMKCIFLSMHNNPMLIARLIEDGADGYLMKDCDPEEMYEALVSAHYKGNYINELSLEAIQKKLKYRNTSNKQYEKLTKREIEILTLICQQKTTEEIAKELFISAKTVNGHRNNLLQKTGSRNMTGLVIYAIKYGIVSPM